MHVFYWLIIMQEFVSPACESIKVRTHAVLKVDGLKIAQLEIQPFGGCDFQH